MPAGSRPRKPPSLRNFGAPASAFWRRRTTLWLCSPRLSLARGASFKALMSALDKGSHRCGDHCCRSFCQVQRCKGFRELAPRDTTWRPRREVASSSFAQVSHFWLDPCRRMLYTGFAHQSWVSLTVWAIAARVLTRACRSILVGRAAHIAAQTGKSKPLPFCKCNRARAFGLWLLDCLTSFSGAWAPKLSSCAVRSTQSLQSQFNAPRHLRSRKTFAGSCGRRGA